MSDAPRPDAPPRRFFQLRLSTILMAIILIGVGLGWFVDRRRQLDTQRRLNMEVQIYERQVFSLQKQLPPLRKPQLLQHRVKAQAAKFEATADEFVTALQGADENKFYSLSSSIDRADEDIFGETLPRVIELLAVPQDETRRRAVLTLTIILQRNPRRLDPFADAAVAQLIPLLSDRDSRVVGEAIETLGLLGPRAQLALKALSAKMVNDGNPSAASAALNVKKIDPNIDIGPRLVELIERKKSDWHNVALGLPEQVSPDVARRVLTKCYENAVNEFERLTIVGALNGIDSGKK